MDNGLLLLHSIIKLESLDVEGALVVPSLQISVARSIHSKEAYVAPLEASGHFSVEEVK